MTGRLVFRCDASPDIGSGHVMRCLALADAAARRGADIVFVSRSGTDRVAPALARAGWPLIHAPDDPSAAASVIAGLLAGRSGAAVVDGYDFGIGLEAGLRERGCRILVLDDLANQDHDCDWLLNASPGFTEQTYRSRVPAGARCLLGPAHALVSGAFTRLRDEAEARRSAASATARRVLVGFGGTDPAGATSPVVAMLADLPGLDVHVAMGGAAPALPAVRDLCERTGATLHVDAEMPGLVLQAEIGIGAGGASTWERCVLGLPSLILTIADNQRFIAEAAAAAGAAVDLGPFDPTAVGAWRSAFLALSLDADGRAAMSSRAMALIDGRGADRVLDEVLG